ncbi:MAG: AlkA N-terminal domain-containing protein [Dermabacter sp.]|nr:AlkA N-terminal domain-containing protein [Dermabacter sp.]
MLSRETCLRAIASRDRRFDGQFFMAVRTTGIYCRPSCPAMTPKPNNVSFYPSAAAAQGAGYRACRRCRPDTVPGSPEWDVRSDQVARAVRMIADGFLDRDGVPALAHRLGYSVRHLQRTVREELGASPVALARAQRAHTARILAEGTDMPLTDVAFAAGFGSVRAFNEAVRTAYGASPRELRGARRQAATPGALSLRLAYREPFEPSNVFGHLAATAIPGVEEWRDGAYRRTLRLPHGPGIVALAPGAGVVEATLWLTDLRDLTPAIARCRRLLDLDADAETIGEQLGRDPLLAPLVAAAPGRRVPRMPDAAEFALRAVIGQQVSTAAARTQAAAIVRRFGPSIEDPAGGLTHLFPSPEDLESFTAADLPGFRARAETAVRMVRALADGTVDLGPEADWDEARSRLSALKGVGPWTIEMIAMRALGDPDAFPATDLGLLRVGRSLGVSLAQLSPRWSPWRSYATQYLWALEDHPISHLPPP